MFVIQYAKTQITCLVVLLYIAINYFYECNKYKRKLSDSYYDEILLFCCVTIIYDGITACTVNLQEIVPHYINIILHGIFFVALETSVCLLFRYLRKTIRNVKRSTLFRVMIYLPWLISVILIIVFLPQIHFIEGAVTNYSMGVSVYVCYTTAFFYIGACMVVVLRSWSYITVSNRIAVCTYLFVFAGGSVLQSMLPETLITSVAITLVVICIYLNQENPAFDEMKRSNKNMVMGFADLVEDRDENTGGHIKRTSEYVELIVRCLRKKRAYRNIMTEDFCEYMVKAAPLHDIGKISTPDAILRKPGKRTEEEYEVMKQHTVRGSQILLEILKNMGDDDYKKVAYDVARSHHEKWNGEGYPEGLSGMRIPLSARIMAVADVFDAVSQKRCYRDAMPIEKCFEIIEEGRGTDFDPAVVDAFLSMRDEATEICMQHR